MHSLNSHSDWLFLLSVINKLLQCLKLVALCVSFDRFSHCFQPLSKQNPQLTEAMHKQFISQLQTLVQVTLMHAHYILFVPVLYILTSVTAQRTSNM